MSLQEKRLFEFGPFRLDARERVLLRDKEIVPIAPKTIELLIALVEQSGRVLGKDELMKQVWPDAIVEEANLSHHVFSLRKALEDDRNGARYIETIPRRGYRFVASVTEIWDEPTESLIKENIRSQVITEEMAEASDAPEMEAVALEQARASQAGPLKRRQALGGPPARLIGRFGSMFTLSPDGRQATFYRYSPDGKQRSMMIAALDGGGEQTLLTFTSPEQGFSGSPSWSPDGKLIAFAAITEPEKRGPNGRMSLFTVGIANREVRALTTELWGEIGKLAWSNDGQKMFFVASRPRIGNQLYSMDYPGGEAHQLTSGVQGYGNYGLGITADGAMLVADGWESSFQIWTVGADGQASGANRLTTGLDDGSSGIAILADGRIAYVSRTGDDRDLWTMKPDGADAKPLTADSFDERDVAATADGRYLVFASNRAGRAHLFRLFRMDADGSNLKQLTFGDGSDATPDCSPDGKWVVYASRSGDKSTIWKIPIEGGAPIQLTDYHSIEPSFSPDGKLISCILPKSSKVERGSLAIVPADGGPPSRTFQVVQFAHYYVTPRWSLDGQSVVYTEKQNGVGNLWKQPLAGGPPQRLTDFKTDLISNFAFSRDGKNIVLARGPKGAYVVLIRDFK